MYLLSEKQTSCMGCGACVDICPKKCISMIEDKEGFLYPKVLRDVCIECHLCEKVCPINYSVDQVSKEEVVKVGIHRNEKIIKKSSSGGAFTAIMKTVLEKGYEIWGVKFDENWKVVHDLGGTLKECESFQKSKYILSDTNHCFSKIEKQLKSGQKILFSGTPCQCAALKNYLNLKRTNQDGLVVIDIICHGAPNQGIFNAYIEEQEKIEKAQILSYEFRNKEPIRNEINSRSARIQFSNGTNKIVTFANDPFLKGYYTRLFYRPSCGQCKFAQPNRVSDLTIGDAWGVEKIYSDLNPLIGVSLLIANSSKGVRLLECIENDFELCSATKEWAIKANAQLRKPTEMHKGRKKFFKLYKKGFSKAVRKSAKKSLIRKTASFIKHKLLRR